MWPWGICDRHKDTQISQTEHFLWLMTMQGGPKKVSHKVLSISLQILTDFQNFSTGAFCGKFVIKWYVTKHTTTP